MPGDDTDGAGMAGLSAGINSRFTSLYLTFSIEPARFSQLSCTRYSYESYANEPSQREEATRGIGNSKPGFPIQLPICSSTKHGGKA